ncbi:MAG: ScpA family protein [Candidatus Komeilibacteria bacterium]
MHKVSLEQFEGPLDLLLQLIEQQELDITTVSLAHVTDQYLQYLEKLEQIVPEEVADFLLVASKLIYLKSKYLLPNLTIADEQDATDLERQLKMYQQYYEASKVIEQMIAKRRFTFVREHPLKVKFEQEFTPPPALKLTDLSTAMRSVIERLGEIKILPRIMMARAVSIKERIQHFRELLTKNIKLSFDRFHDKDNKVDTIVSFLALLELVKQRFVTVEQENLFTEITICSNPLQQPKLNE